MVPRARPMRFLLHALDEAYGVPAWHGPNLRGSLRGVTARTASWRPEPGRHNIRDLVLHAAYWKYRVRRRLTGEERGSFTIAGNNFFNLPDPTEKQWRRERDLLDGEHRALRQAVAALSVSRLTQKIPSSSGR